MGFGGAGRKQKKASRRPRPSGGRREAASSIAVVDARGALCPVPTVMAALALEERSAGCLIDVRADDPTTRRDLPVWCAEFGHRVVFVREGRAEFCVRIQKGLSGGGKK